MKKYLLIFVLSLAIISCEQAEECKSMEFVISPAPKLTYPTDGLLCIGKNLNFTWEGSIGGEGIVYEIEISEKENFSELFKIPGTATTSSLKKTISLDAGTRYYYRVIASAPSAEDKVSSSIFQFYTEGVGVVNHLPFSPGLVGPDKDIKVTGNSATLEWTASDVDINDTLTFDVYLDTKNPPEASVAIDHDNKRYIASSLQSGTMYYWKIVVKDNNGGTTSGRVWNFETE